MTNETEPAGPRCFRSLRPGSGPGTVLAIDAGLGMADGSFPSLARRLTTACAVYESVPPVYCPDAWVRDIRACGFDVRAVLGYCSGASLAWALADRVAGADGGRPVLVLLDPVPVTTPELWFVYERFIATFRGALSPAGYQRARHFAGDAAERHGDDIAAFAAELREGYTGIARGACASLGLSEESADDFIDRFDTQLAFMLAAAGQPFPAGSGTPVVLLSREAAGPPGGLVDAHRFDVPRAELFTAQAVADVVTELVGR